MKLELTPEIQAGLQSQAQEKGLSPEAYAVQVLGERLGGTSQPGLEAAELSPDEWMREYRAWAHSHDADERPILSDGAISRDSIYD